MPVAPFAPRNRRSLAGAADRLEVHEQVRRPERRALADRRGLRGLVVRVGERRQVAVRQREVAQAPQHRDEAPFDERQALAHLDEVRVVRDVGRRGAPVDDAARRGRRRAEDAHVGHDVVPRRLLFLRRRLEIDVREVARASARGPPPEIGRPSRRSSSASQSQSRRQVSNLNWAEKMRDISAEA